MEGLRFRRRLDYPEYMELYTFPRLGGRTVVATLPIGKAVRGAYRVRRRPDELHTLGSRLVGYRPSGRTVAFVAAGSAAAAGALAVIQQAERIRRPRHLAEYEITTLAELADEEEALATIQQELLAEWGAFAPQDMTEMRRLVERAGHLSYVIRFREEDGSLGPPCGVLQTARADIGGDPERLTEVFESFNAITDSGTWERSPEMAGDTALLLQITAFGERSRGVGSRLRDAALYSLPREVRFALTTTPVDDSFDPAADAGDYPPAVNFHYRGGAELAGYARGFKLPPAGADVAAGRQHNRNVAFMRYTRASNGEWVGVRRPEHLPSPRDWRFVHWPTNLHLPRRAA